MGANPIPIVAPCNRVTRGVEIPTTFVGGTDRRHWLETAQPWANHINHGRRVAAGLCTATAAFKRRPWLGSIWSSQPLCAAWLTLVMRISSPVLSITAREEIKKNRRVLVRELLQPGLQCSTTARSSSLKNESRAAPRSSHSSCISKLSA